MRSVVQPVLRNVCSAIGVPFGGINWTSFWNKNLSVGYTLRDNLDFLETVSGKSLNAKIIPSVGKIDASNYVYKSVNNFESGDASGYIEARFYFDGTSTGIHYLFSTTSESATARYCHFYVSNKYLYFDIRQNITTVFRNRFYRSVKLSAGWHTVRVTSSGGAYSMTIDGTTYTIGSGLTLSDGANDGRWIDLVTLRNNVMIGMTKYSTGEEHPSVTFKIDYVDYNNKHKWILHGQGTYIFDLIGSVHMTWSGTSHQDFDLNGSTLLLNSGYSLWKKYGSPDEYVPYVGGNPYDVSSTLTGYTKVSDHAGSLTTFNLAPALIDFDYNDNTPAELLILDRSDTDFQTDYSRASSYYDSSNPYRYHSSEIANPTIYNQFFKAGYRGMFYSKITVTDSNYNYYPVNVSGMYLLKRDVKANGQYVFMTNMGSISFAAQDKSKDSDGYLLTKLTDIKHFGVKSSNTDEENTALIQRAVKYAYHNSLTFGSSGETYIITQPILLESYKTYQIDSTLKLKNATVVYLTSDYVAGDDHVHVTSTTGFNIGEWVSITADDKPKNYPLGKYGICFWITNIDRNNNIIYFDATRGASSIYNFTVSNNARLGHTQNILLADTKTDITLTGSGLLDGNYLNQSGINACLPNVSWFEEHKASSCVTFWCCNNINIEGLDIDNPLRFTGGLRHNINCTGYDNSNRTTNVHAQYLESTYAYNKNFLIRYCTGVIIEDYVGNDAVCEDGLMFYLHNIDCEAYRIECKRNGRCGIGWNGAQSGNLTVEDIVTENNVYAGFYSSCDNVTGSNFTMKDRLIFSNVYDNCDDISISGITIDGYTSNNGLYSNCVVGFFGEVTNIALSNVTVQNCTSTGAAFKTTNDYTPANPPVNVVINGGGLYSHTGTMYDLYSPYGIDFNNFRNG